MIKIDMRKESITYCKGFNKHFIKRISILIVLLLSVISVQKANAQFKCAINGSVSDGKKKLELAVVTLYKGKTVIQQISTNASGKFNFNLEPNAEYTISLTRPGYITKKIMYSTLGISAETAKNFSKTFYPEVDLFEMPKDPSLASQINAIVSQPVGKLYYDPNKYDILNDEGYAESIQNALANLRRLQEEAMKKLEEENKRYRDALAKGNAAMVKQDWANAKTAYTEASAIKKYEQYPKDKIAECDKELAALAGAAELEAKYKAAIAKGDAAFGSKDYQNAKSAYNEAIALKQNEKYPRDKVAEIDKLLGDASKNAELEAKYKAAIDKGDAAFTAKDYTNAKAGYFEALGIKPKEKYPTDKLAEIEKILADLAGKEKADKALTEKYNALIKKADNALLEKRYLDAKTAYTDALGLKPNEQYPKDKLAEVNALIDKDASLKQLEEKYNAAIAKGDKALSTKTYADAKSAYNEALTFKPNEQYPKDKLAEIEKILANELSAKQLEENYKAAIAKGDAALSSKDYNNAKSAYNEALGLKPNEKYPKDKLAEIDRLLAAEMSAKELNDKYNAAIDKADAAFGKQDYSAAKDAYNEALGLKPAETYPKVKLAAIDKILADLAADKALTEKYNALIAKADNSFGSKKYADAKTTYNDALALKPNEKYPKDKIAEIDAIFAKQLGEKQLEENYKAAIAKGDKALAAKDYSSAKTGYTDALGLKPNEQYPKDKLAELEALMAKELAEKQLEERYKAAIAKADGAFGTKDYSNAKAAYNEALGIKPSEKYPVDKIAEIDKLLAAEMSAKELDERYKAAIAKGDAALASKDYAAAKTGYSDALGFKPSEQYPKDKLAEIEKTLRDLAAEKELNEKYAAAIAKGDAALAAKSYMAAKGNYSEASGLKPNEQYPKDKIAEIDALLAKDAAALKLEQDYQAAISKGDASMIAKDYENSRSAYMDALKLKPNEQYPKDKLAELEKLIANVQKEKEINDRYNAAIAKADAAFGSLEYQNAKTEYNNALGIKPNEDYPKTKIAEINRLLAEMAEKEKEEKERAEKYKAVIAKADKAFGAKTYAEAKALYYEAVSLSPGEQYPKDRIAEIDDIVAKELADRQKEENYKAAILRGDASFAEKDYLNAKTAYESASNLKPSELYPKNKISEIDAILAKEQVAKQLEADYKKAIALGDIALSASDYENSKNSYSNALRLKPNEQYPKDQIAKIDKILSDIEREKGIKEKYNNAIAKGDAAFSTKDYKGAIAAYKEAQTFKPNEIYPASRISDINRILDDLARQKDKDDRYNAAIALADKIFATKEYRKARGLYSDALIIKPAEKYPIDKMAEIDALLKKTGSTIVTPVAVKKEDNKNDLAQRYPEGITEEYATEQNASLVKRIVVKGNEGHLYIQKTTKFGAIYWTRDGVPITEQEYIKKTEQ